MRNSPLKTAAVLGAVVFATFGAASGLRYPPTPVLPVADTYFGTTVRDPYRWLEDGADPKVKAWAAAQSELTRSYVQAQPAYAPIAARVRALSITGTVRFGLSIAANAYVYFRQTPPQAQAQLVARTGLAGEEHVIFDPAANASGAPPSIEGTIYLSHDGKHVVFTTPEGGAEDQTLHVADVATGTLLPDTISHVGGGTSPSAVAWDADGKGFLHTRFPIDANGKAAPFGILVYHHTLGEDPGADTYVFGKGQPKTAEMHLAVSPSGEHTGVRS